MKYSVIIPHLSNSKFIDGCLDALKRNSIYEHEIITIVDETDVYYAFNKGVYQASCEIVVLLNDDMFVGKDWDKLFPVFISEDTFLTFHVVEANPGLMEEGRSHCIKYDCGDTSETFDSDKFDQYITEQSKIIPMFQYNVMGWYMPLVVHKKSFISYPNIIKFPHAPNDVLLLEHVLPYCGYSIALLSSFVYHFSGKARKEIYKENLMTKPNRAIFTYCNHQIEDRIAYLQKQVINKFNTNKLCKYEYLQYKKPDGEMTPDQVIDYGINKLFYEDNYDTILLLDIDCIPLSTEALEYTFELAEQGVLVGNVQRSNHIDNNKHTYPAPSCVALSKDMFERLGKPSFSVSNRGDIGEELAYIAEQKGIQIEMFMPGKHEEVPYWNTGERKLWDLADGQPQFGIGTTFVDKNGKEMFYHLFQSRLNVFNDLFFLKCASIML
jgi:hypothetical protein